MPVKITTSGNLPAGFQLQSIEAEPDSVPLHFKTELNIDSIAIDPIDLSSVTGSTTFTRPLELPENTVLPPNASKEIKVHLSIIRDEG
ncbi:MAG: YbbR-like domain-containing protein [Balneolaceae bacterium]|nr:YbbR-like domain-containing protein [Balneolaceae bacterium]